jgi:hypothetical protein
MVLKSNCSSNDKYKKVRINKLKIKNKIKNLLDILFKIILKKTYKLISLDIHRIFKLFSFNANLELFKNISRLLMSMNKVPFISIHLSFLDQWEISILNKSRCLTIKNFVSNALNLMIGSEKVNF